MSATSADELVEELDEKHTLSAEDDIPEMEAAESCVSLSCWSNTY
ncbi:hypothetical protein [Halobaculum sp. MBLA0143]